MTGSGIDANQVVIAESQSASYGALIKPLPAPELPSGEVVTVPGAAVRELFRLWGLDAARFGSRDWNPLGELLEPGAFVTLKPNWVLHQNQSGAGLECLVTDTGVIRAVLEYVALARPRRVVVGDAPVQGCDFERLRELCGLDTLAEDFRRRGVPVEIADFRRTVLPDRDRPGGRQYGVRPLEAFVLFDLAGDSLLEDLAADADKFRVTMYNPDLLERTHAPGRHQYLIAREVIEADAVINLPKLKSHKKACLTGALKNLIGINGNKEYLPHHRKGGGGAGGDCYPGRSWFKAMAEELLDAANRSRSGGAQRLGFRSAALLASCARRLQGCDTDLEGSWHGNDTIWRTCLDLQRILHYGRADDASLAPSQQRPVITITDAIIGGEGEGPLAPTPVGSGFLTGGLNTAAVEWINARLMGFDPQKIPLVREAFGHRFRYPLAAFAPAQIRVQTAAAGPQPPEKVRPLRGRPFLPPRGWLHYSELDHEHDTAIAQ